MQLEDHIAVLNKRLVERDEELEILRAQSREFEEIKRRLAREVDQVATNLKSVIQSKEYLQKQLDDAYAEIENLRKEAHLRVRLREEHEREVAALRREIDMRDVDYNLHEAKLRLMKDENTKVRMQLRDPSNIKRAPFSTDMTQPADLIDDFDRVQKNYDMLTLQEELKQMIIENSLLK